MQADDVRVLIVDDEELVRTAMRNVLAMYGWSVTAVGTATEALARVREGPDRYGLVIVDLVLDGEIGGLGLADILHRLEPGASFLFVSGSVARGIPKETLADVPQAFLGKPFSVKQLIDRATLLLEESQEVTPEKGRRP